MYKPNTLYVWEQNYSFIVEGISVGQLAQNLGHKELHNETSWVLLVAFKSDEFVKKCSWQIFNLIKWRPWQNPLTQCEINDIYSTKHIIRMSLTDMFKGIEIIACI